MAQAELSNVDIAVYALFRLRGHERKLHTEEIAYEAYGLAKERFGWKLAQFRKKCFPGNGKNKNEDLSCKRNSVRRLEDSDRERKTVDALQRRGHRLGMIPT